MLPLIGKTAIYGFYVTKSEEPAASVPAVAVGQDDCPPRQNSAKRFEEGDLQQDDGTYNVFEVDEHLTVEDGESCAEGDFFEDMLCDSSEDEDFDHLYSFPPGLGKKKSKALKLSLSNEKLDKLLFCFSSINTTLSRMYGIERRKLRLLNTRNKLTREKNYLFREMLWLKKHQFTRGRP